MILIADGIALVGVLTGGAALIAFAVSIGTFESIAASAAAGSLESAIFN